MPELPEVEAYRRLAEKALGREVVDVEAPDPWYLKGGIDAATIRDALVGRRLTSSRRTGKVLLIDTDGGPTLGLRFGMTGRLVLDGVPGVDRLQYSSNADHPAWDRFALGFGSSGRMAIRDPRRLGGVTLDPDESRLGPDALGVSTAVLRQALGGSTAPLKARLMDQAHLAGVGNLIADEVLWRAGLDPVRAAGSLSPAEVRRLAGALRTGLGDLISRGGSHQWDFGPFRVPGGRCPKDGGALVKRTVGGRTTWSCPVHQR